eukprot:12666222-Heterocapsa_arctica.AAC.1
MRRGCGCGADAGGMRTRGGDADAGGIRTANVHFVVFKPWKLQNGRLPDRNIRNKTRSGPHGGMRMRGGCSSSSSSSRSSSSRSGGTRGTPGDK